MAEKLYERCAVITGDVVKSSKLPDDLRRKLSDILRKAYADLKAMAPALFPEDVLRYPLAVFRGDAIQMVVVEPEYAAHAAVAFRALVLAASEKPRIELRLALGIGPIDFVPGNDVHEGDGEAFRLSGRALDEMKSSATLAVASETSERQAALKTVLSLVDAVTDAWTPNQARAVAGAMKGRTQEQIAASWPGKPTSQQNVWRQLRRAHWDAVHTALEFVRNTLR